MCLEINRLSYIEYMPPNKVASDLFALRKMCVFRENNISKTEYYR